jgi:hypothetical protein
VTLLGLLGRALAVTLLFGVLLLPAADHHLAARLPGAHDLDAHGQQMHHHGAGAGDEERGDAGPLLLPLGPAGAGPAAPLPFVALPLGAPALALGRSAAAEPSRGAPPPLLEPPPLPPPILTA